MASIKDKLSRGLEESMSRRMEREADALAAMSDEELFSFAEYDEKESEKTGYSNYSYWGSTIRMFLKNRGAVCMLVIMLAILIFTIIQPYLPGQMDPNLVNADPERFIPLRNVPPGADFWFGTNSIGQDLWARIWTGTRTSLFIGFSVALVEAVAGITVGVLWGYIPVCAGNISRHR